MRLSKVLASLAVVLLAHQPVLAQSVSERIAAAKTTFDEVLRQTPDKEVRAAAFFTNDVSLEEVRSALQRAPTVVIKGFRHGTESYAGGYGLKPGETIDQGIASYKRDHLFFLEQRLNMESRMPARVTDTNLKQALAVHRKEAEQMKADFQTRGLRIVGIELAGKVNNLKRFMDSTSFVRVLELTENGRSRPAILPQQ